MKVDFIRDGDHLRVDDATAAYFNEMDHHEAHAGYHTICRSVYRAAKGVPPALGGDLISQGIDVIRNCIEPGTGAEFSARIDAAIGQSTPPNTTVPLNDEFRADLGALLHQVLSDAVVAMVEHYMGSHFRVVQCQLYRTETGGEPHVSFLWHRDMEPMAQVHIMVYLTASGPDDPGTAFLSVEDTRRLADNGYAFPQFAERIADVAQALPPGAQAPKVIRPDLAAGDATIFGAPRLLHRGVDGRGGKRDVFLVNLLPSLVPWHHDISRFGTGHLFWDDAISDTLLTDPFALILKPAPRFSGKPVSDWVIKGNLLPDGFD